MRKQLARASAASTATATSATATATATETSTLPQTILKVVVDANSQNAIVNWCRWDLEPFEGPVLQLPLHFDEALQCFEGVECFCSVECMYAYRLEHVSAQNIPLNLIHKLHRMISKESSMGTNLTGTGASKKSSILTPAPPRQALRRFGGEMSIEEFRGTRQWYALLRSPFIPVTQFVEMNGIHHQSQQISSGILVPTTTSTASTAIAAEATDANTLVLKREKPHPNFANQWKFATAKK